MTSLLERPYQHAAVLYGSREELRSTAVPFLSDGFAAGESAVPTCSEDHKRLLVDALPDDAPVIPIGGQEIYSRPEHAVSSYRRLVKRQIGAGAAGVRLVGEVRFGTRALPRVIHDGIMQAHPLLLTTDGTVANGRYLHAATILRRVAGSGPHPVEAADIPPSRPDGPERVARSAAPSTRRA